MCPLPGLGLVGMAIRMLAGVQDQSRSWALRAAPCVVICAALAHADIATADLVTPVGFASVVSMVDNIGAIPTEVGIGTTLNFAYGFESTSFDSDPSPELGVYFGGADSPIFVRIFEANDILFACSSSDIGIANQPGDDRYVVLGDVCTGPATAIDLVLLDQAGTAISSDALPVQLDLADWAIATLFIDGCPTANPFCDPETEGFAIDALIFDFQYLPEPSSGVLSLAALSVLSGLARRKRAPIDL